MTNQVHGLGSTYNVTKFLICHIAATVQISDAITDSAEGSFSMQVWSNI